MSHLDALLAYIDPGAGSLLIQSLIAALIAIPVFLRREVGIVAAALRRRFRRGDRDE